MLRGAALVGLSMLGTALAGCASGAAEPLPPATAPVGTGCPNPDCGRQGAAKPPAETDASAEEQERAKVAEIRAPGAVILDAKGDSPVRGILVSNGRQLLVEVCVKEVAAPREKRPGLVRFTLRPTFQVCTK